MKIWVVKFRALFIRTQIFRAGPTIVHSTASIVLAVCACILWHADRGLSHSPPPACVRSAVKDEVVEARVRRDANATRGGRAPPVGPNALHGLPTENAPPRRILRATKMVRAPYWIRSADPNHPKMRTYVDRRKAHTANLVPENSFWKDHDSQVRSSPG